MWNRLRRSLTSNWGLKLLAVFFAVALWLVVVNVDDPEISRTFTASVTVTNEDVLTEQGMYYTVPDNNYTVSFRVTAKRSIIEKLSNSDFVATADMNYLDGDKVPVDITATTYSNSISLSAKNYYLNVKVGEIQNNNFVINGATSGDPADGCTVKDITVSPNIVTVEGPDDIVASIDSVTATLDVSGYSDDVSSTVVPVFKDKNGKTVDTTQLTINVSSVNVSVDICAVKDITFNVETTGTVASGLNIASITTDPETIKVMGEASALSSFSEITIPGELIDVSGLADSKEYVVDITQYLPDGVSLVDSTQNQVTVTVTASDTAATVVSVPTSDITVNGLTDGYTAVFNSGIITVHLTGASSALTGLDASSIGATVDLTGLDVGTHTVNLSFSLPDGVTATSVSVKVNIVAQ